MKAVILKKGREASVLRHHPWVFSGAIEKAVGEPAAGETVRVRAHDGRNLGIGGYSPDSQIRVRIWSFDGTERIDTAFFRKRLAMAVEARRSTVSRSTGNAVRLVYGESDGLPGLIVDRYGEYLVCQFLYTGVEFWKATLVEALREVCPCKGIYERSDVAVRAKEGLAETTGTLYGQTPPESIEMVENGCVYRVDVCRGHKTGFYLDQSRNRARVAELAAGRDVLNCFSYSGGFGVAALMGGARFAVNLDASRAALELAAVNFALNGYGDEHYENLCGDAFDLLRRLQEDGRRFDMVILDPPKFADSRRHLVRAARAYKDIALQGSKLLRPNGLLVNFSCSGAIEPGLFQKITADAVLDAGRSGQIIDYLSQAEDHPVALSFPESMYLKGLICRIT
ncbi:MAG TPA: class I SAM-dependent rRNA methyltransferase [Gammaproteobacteria bacterium]